MKGSVVQTLIFSDWHRHRMHILMCLVAGALAFALIQVGGELPTILGVTWFFVSLIVFGSMLPVSNVINERKKHNLAFLMSLPLSAAQYTIAKLVSTVGMFLVSWLTLVVAALSFIVSHPVIPDGMIPSILILAMFTFVGFCVIAAVALVSESEGATVAATVVANSFYGFGWYLLVRNPVIRGDMKSLAPVWSREVLTILGVEIGLMALILGLTFYLQSRKRDFI
jgi:ABC-2 type transport system permease protein